MCFKMKPVLFYFILESCRGNTPYNSSLCGTVHPDRVRGFLRDFLGRCERLKFQDTDEGLREKKLSEREQGWSLLAQQRGGKPGREQAWGDLKIK